MSMYEELVGGGLYILGVSKVVFEQMFEYRYPCTTRAVSYLRPQRLYNAQGRRRSFRTFWATQTVGD